MDVSFSSFLCAKEKDRHPIGVSDGEATRRGQEPGDIEDITDVPVPVCHCRRNGSTSSHVAISMLSVSGLNQPTASSGARASTESPTM